ncbi:mechanosensitive ion channel family protein [Akkermansiaceae bacterium]|nr:mechanosensitive ion channel family protein [Akkermansiaceae bacterium]
MPDLVNKPLEILTGSISNIIKSSIEHLPNFIGAILIVLVTLLIKFVLGKILNKTFAKLKMRKSLQELFITLAKTLVISVGFLSALTVLFPSITPSKILGAAGLASVAVGLAFKDIFQNFFAGIIILWKFPFEPGDYIECGDHMGIVEETELRITTLRRPSGELVVIPNSELVNNPIEVLTHADTRRVEITTGIAYDEDIKPAIEIIKNALKGCKTITSPEKNKVLVSNFGASSIDIDVLIWTKSKPGDIREAKNEVITAIKDALDANGIEIPFPYRTLTFKEPLNIHSHSKESGA